jgi:hypothetical protein
VTIAQAVSEFPGVTYKQMRECFKRLIERKLARAVVSGVGGRSAVYRGAAVPVVTFRASCVWSTAPIVLPRVSGQKYQPLGEW